MNFNPEIKVAMPIAFGSTIFLKIVIGLIALVFVSLCTIVLPMGLMMDTLADFHLLILWLYIPVIPFFIALYQAFSLLRYIEAGRVFTGASAASLRRIKMCAFAISILFLAAIPYFLLIDEMESSFFISLIGYVIIGVSVVIATFAGLMQKLISDAAEIKSENDLTV